jgi:hypothetical protein
MYSQFSEVKFSSVALAETGVSGTSRIARDARQIYLLTDGIIEDVLLSAKHGCVHNVEDIWMKEKTEHRL